MAIPTQITLAEAAGVKEHDLRNIKSGRTQNPKSHILARLATALRTTEAWLREESGPEDSLEISNPNEIDIKAALDAAQRQAYQNAARLTELVAEVMRADPEIQAGIISAMEGFLSGSTARDVQKPARPSLNKSRD